LQHIKHFTLKRKPKAAALKVELLNKSQGRRGWIDKFQSHSKFKKVKNQIKTNFCWNSLYIFDLLEELAI
jgi:hypothetical protein